MLTATQDATATTIPDKLFFKIGEVCDLVGVQAHVLRYWESEFPMLQPQKNRAGQRTYRRKDVEMALRIKGLLYDEGFTIAGAKKKLQTEGRTATPSRFKVVPPGATAADFEPVTTAQPAVQTGQGIAVNCRQPSRCCIANHDWQHALTRCPATAQIDAGGYVDNTQPRCYRLSRST